MKLGKWKSEVDGTLLRELIKEQKGFNILAELARQLTYITSFPNKFNLDEYDVQEFKDLLDIVSDEVTMGEVSLAEYISGEEWIDSLNELIDDRLAQFYDLCDNYRIWISK